MSARCRNANCGASIFWAESVNGKLMPMDSDPAIDGVFKIEDDDSDRNPIAVFVPPIERASAAGWLYNCHYNACKGRS